jgi:hypothetical protein
MPRDLSVLIAHIMGADLQALGSLTLCDGADDIPGIEGDCDAAEVLARGCVAATRGRHLPWVKTALAAGAEEDIGEMGARLARAQVRVLGALSLAGDWVAAARLAWRLCGGAASDFRGEGRSARWIAGPAGLACWGGVGGGTPTTDGSAWLRFRDGRMSLKN